MQVPILGMAVLEAKRDLLYCAWPIPEIGERMLEVVQGQGKYSLLRFVIQDVDITSSHKRFKRAAPQCIKSLVIETDWMHRHRVWWVIRGRGFFQDREDFHWAPINILFGFENSCHRMYLF